jgi:hypothetical protein
MTVGIDRDGLPMIAASVSTARSCKKVQEIAADSAMLSLPLQRRDASARSIALMIGAPPREACDYCTLTLPLP